MIGQGPFFAPSQHCQTVRLQKGVWTYSTLYPRWKKMHHLFTQGSKKGHSQTSFPCKTRMFFCDWSSQDRFGPLHSFQFHTPYVRVLEPRRTWEHDSVRRDSVKTKGEGLCGEEHLKNAFCDKDKPFSLDWYWCTRSMKPQDFNPIQS